MKSLARQALAVALVLPAALACRAEESAVTPSVPAPGSAPPGAPAAVHRHAGRRLTVAQGIDESVHRLARGLDLDAAQQESVRQILVDQHRRIVKLRSADTSVAPDVAEATLAIYEQTKARIRGLLNDEQRKKYIADVPRGDLAPAQADLKHWIDLQDSRRRQGQVQDQTK